MTTKKKSAPVLQQFFLDPAQRFNGRAVRLRFLEASEHLQIQSDVARAHKDNEDLTAIELRVATNLEMVQRALHSYTEPLKAADQVPGAKWLLADVATLETQWSRLFGPREQDVLFHWFRRNHSVSEEEAEIVLGKALLVEDGGDGAD